MHAADPDKSARLKRVLGVLADGLEHTTQDIMQQAHVCAVNSCISELRVAGHDIPCRIAMVEGSRRWFYKLERRQPQQLALQVAA